MGTSGRLFELAGAIGCKDIYNVPDGVGGRFSVLSAVGLLPAAVLGLNVVKLLEGAVDSFRKAMRANQLWNGLYVQGATDFGAMTTLAKSFRAELDGAFSLQRPEIVTAQVSADVPRSSSGM